jgi:hypothetical protein
VVRSLICIALATASLAPAVTVFSEGFDNVAGLAGAGWSLQNLSTPSAGSTDWFQGNPAIFPAQSGATNSYVAANFENAPAGGNIDNWLITPVISVADGTTISFYAQAGGTFPDAIELRLNTSGTTTVGAFTFLQSIDPVPSGQWTLYTATLSGIGGPVNSRIAFRYLVTDTNTNGDYIGIDTLSVDNVPEPATLTLVGLAISALGLYRRYGKSS